MNVLRTIFTFTLLGLYTVPLAIIVIVIGYFVKYSDFSYEVIAKAWSRWQLWCAGIKVNVKGQENLQDDQSYMIVCNHQSHSDIPVMLAHMPMRMTIIAKQELFKIPFFGPGIRALGILPIDRKNREKAFRTLKEAAKVIHERNISVLAFPEGTRTDDGKMQPFKKGPFMLAVDAEIPILPVTIDGTFAIFPKGSYTFKPGNVTLTIHPPISVEGYSRANRDQLMAIVHETMSRGLYETVE
ncbi:MAG: lysophospholipid acyltransferase family protein [Calditrichia bacterium]